MNEFVELPEIRAMFELRDKRESGLVPNLLQERFANYLLQYSHLSIPAQLYLQKEFKACKWLV